MLRRISLTLVLLLTVICAHAQKASVSGTISDERGNPVDHALVADESTGFGMYTECNGRYMLEVPAGQNITFIYYANDFKAVRRQFVLAPGATHTLNVQLERLEVQPGSLTPITPCVAEMEQANDKSEPGVEK